MILYKEFNHNIVGLDIVYVAQSIFD